MEKIVHLTNGQWRLEKWTGDQRRKADNWVYSGDRSMLSDLPEAEGNLRTKMLEDMTSDMQPGVKESHSRINPSTGKKEFFLYRAKRPYDDRHNSKLTSWTIHPNFAKYWSGIMSNIDGYKPVHIVGAWIPDDMIHSYMPTVSRTEAGAELSSDNLNSVKDEGEVIVKPHKIDIRHMD